MNIRKKFTTTTITAIVIMIATSTTTTFPNVAVFATPFFAQGGNDTITDATTIPATAAPLPPLPPTNITIPQGQQQQQQPIHITKEETNSYIISGETSISLAASIQPIEL